MNEYHDVFEYLRNLNWYLQFGLDRCIFLADGSRATQTKTKKELKVEADVIKSGFDDMETRIRNMINASSTFPSPLKNQIYITLDQSMKIFGGAAYLGTPNLQDVIITVFIKTNYHVLLDSFLNKYTDEEVRKVMIYCINDLIYSIRELDILRRNHEEI